MACCHMTKWLYFLLGHDVFELPHNNEMLSANYNITIIFINWYWIIEDQWKLDVNMYDSFQSALPR